MGKQAVNKHKATGTLVGRYFHEFSRDLTFIMKQGQVVDSLPNDMFLLDVHKRWTTVESADGLVLVSLRDMLRWRFYSTAEQMATALKNHCSWLRRQHEASKKSPT